MKYVIRLKHSGEYLMDESSDDAYTDDLDEAIIFDDFAEAKSVCASEEEVVLLGKDDEGEITLEVIR